MQIMYFMAFFFCRFPGGVPWKNYSGELDGLNVHIVVPGKDKALGLHSFNVLIR